MFKLENSVLAAIFIVFIFAPFIVAIFVEKSEGHDSETEDRMKRLEYAIVRDEGLRLKPYLLDGIAHIGVGRNLVGKGLSYAELIVLNGGKPLAPDKHIFRDRSHYPHWNAHNYIVFSLDAFQHFFPNGITEEGAHHLLLDDINDAKNICIQLVTWQIWEELNKPRQEVLINLAFNLGEPRLSEFVKMLAAIDALDYEKAAEELLDSEAARSKELKQRYQRLAITLRTGQYVYMPRQLHNAP